MTANDKVLIFDTTLRDGEQAPGFSMDHDQKLRMARALSELGVDIIEAGFPAASKGDFRAVNDIARQTSGTTICGLARAVEGDIRATAEAVAPAAKKRIHTFIATSPIHREHKLNMDKATVLARAVEAVRMARSFVDDVEFSAEDALRTEPDFLIEVFSAVIEAGARTINIPDTVGYATPEDIYRLFSDLRLKVKGAENVVLSAHCHDDLGLAVANSLAAVRAGARQVECAMNGIGERAGNCATEEIIMALKTRADSYALGTDINTRKLYGVSKLLSGLTGHAVPRNKAIVGENAFAHESGIHQDGILKNVETYEIMKPEDIGVPKSQLVLGKHSGRHAFAERARALGHDLSPDQIDEAFTAFKTLADRKKVITNSDIEGLILGKEMGTQGPWHLKTLQVSTGSGDGALHMAAVHLVHDTGRAVREASMGNGPLDAAFKAIKRATKASAALADFSVRSIGAGADAQGWSDVRLVHDDVSVHGSGVDTDIVHAGAKAYLDALNRLIREAKPDPKTTAPASSARALSA
ncbi:2-isopropylmalate synthase [Iodidimonas gelatinilytica]|uniref:2-isopropylmalate synthase n=1 Tax=Iodidimonas gelatinilytica TaxID=1236966 RepID=A0A5A7MWE3_9PROT|nr:2-isopropylmalate synthase [Iodidimonas gelatinilytica]GER00147.1 2-isopropylmalate synthase [Iodidimonas gelatinilytica]